MATTIGTEADVIDMLNTLIRLDLDVIEAYQTAIDRLDNATTKTRFIAFKSDHEHHTRALDALVMDLGGKPATQSDAKTLLTRGKMILRGVTGDNGILQAMKGHEDDTNEVYEQMLVRHEMSTQIRDLLQHNLADEQRHRAYIEERLDQT